MYPLPSKEGAPGKGKGVCAIVLHQYGVLIPRYYLTPTWFSKGSLRASEENEMHLGGD